MNVPLAAAELRSKASTLCSVTVESALKALSRLSPKPSPMVLMYHDVSRDAGPGFGPWEHAVTPAEFERHVATLADEFTVVTIDRLVSWLRGGETLPEDAAVLTFDDGYESVLTDALPILERYGVPATVYVTTDHMVREAAPFEYRLAAALAATESVTVDVGDARIDKRLATTGARQSVYRRLKQFAKQAGTEERARLLDALNAPDTAHRIADPEQVRALAESSAITIGSHGHRHVPLTAVPRERLRNDVVESRRLLETTLDQSVTHFSYPYGARDRSVRRAVERAGFESAVTTTPRRVSEVDRRRLFALPRFNGVDRPWESTA